MTQKKNFLFVTWKNDAGQLAGQVAKEGHNVKIYIDYKSCKDCWDGMVEKVPTAIDKARPWQKWTDWADIIVFDEIGFGKHAAALRASGKKVVGGTPYTDKLEWEREFGQSEMERVGMRILPHWEFTDFAKALRFIVRRPQRYVFKPSGVVASANHNLLLVGEAGDGKDIFEILRANRQKWRHKIKRFMLQRYASGIEVAVGAFFNGKKFLSPVCVNQEYKRLFPGDIGPLTNDMGAMVYWDKPNALYRETLQKMEADLAKAGYTGYFDINCIVEAGNIYPLEFTARFGYPTIDAQLAGFNMPAGEFLRQLASGKDFAINVKPGVQVGVSVVLPPFISAGKNGDNIYRDMPILVRNPKLKWDELNLFFKDAKVSDGHLRVAGEARFVCVAGGSGTTVEKARRAAYSRIKQIQTPNMFYRSDIGAKWEKDGAVLRKWKLIN